MLSNLVFFSFLLLIGVGMALPSDGNHGIFAPKTLAFLNAGFWFVIYYLSNFKLNLSQAKISLFVLIFTLFLGIWYVVGIDQTPQITSGQFDQFKVFLTTLFVPAAGWYLYQAKLITVKNVFLTAIYTNFAYCAAKVLLMTLHLLGILNVWTFMHKTGLRFMSMQILGDVGRIQTSVDIATPFLIYFVLNDTFFGLSFSKKMKWTLLILGALSTFLSFSRLLMFAYALSVFLYGMTLKLEKQLQFWLATLIFGIASIVAIGPEKVEKVIEKRLFSSDNYNSDAVRHQQVEALLKGCDEAPFIGKGLGGYTTECIRDTQLPHAYEVQWVAFLMQFGLFGIFFLIFPIGYLLFMLIRPPLSRVQLGAFVLLLLWVVSGFTNPFMISLTSGIIYLLFLFAGNRQLPSFNR